MCSGHYRNIDCTGLSWTPAAALILNSLLLSLWAAAADCSSWPLHVSHGFLSSSNNTHKSHRGPPYACPGAGGYFWRWCWADALKYLLLCFCCRQAANCPGGAPLRRSGEGEPRAKAEGRNQHGQAGSPATEGASWRHGEWTKSTEVCWRRARTGDLNFYSRTAVAWLLLSQSCSIQISSIVHVFGWHHSDTC